MTVWMYYETDGDSGYYHVTIFKSEAGARRFEMQRNSAYGKVVKIEVLP